MSTAEETLASIGEGTFETFKPSSEVSRNIAYGIEVFEDVGLVSEAEFFRLSGMTVKEAGLKEKEDVYSLKWNGPDGTPSKLWVIGLKGLPFEEIVGMKGGRIFYRDVANNSQMFLLPQDQLTPTQATHVFPHVFQLQISDKVSGLKPSGIDKVKHVVDLKEKQNARQLS